MHGMAETRFGEVTKPLDFRTPTTKHSMKLAAYQTKHRMSVLDIDVPGCVYFVNSLR